MLKQLVFVHMLIVALQPGGRGRNVLTQLVIHHYLYLVFHAVALVVLCHLLFSLGIGGANLLQPLRLGCGGRVRCAAHLLVGRPRVDNLVKQRQLVSAHLQVTVP